MINLLEESLKRNIIREGRAVGNTTRQVDLAIDLLHQGEEIEVIDHAKISNPNGEHQMNIYLYSKLRERFDIMYKYQSRVKLEKMENQNKMILKLNIKS